MGLLGPGHDSALGPASVAATARSAAPRYRVDVMDGHAAPGGYESATVQAFILEQQHQVLASARERLAACAADDLAREAHRLRGTLGTYQMIDGVTAMTALEQAATADGVDDASLEAARADAVAALSAIGAVSADERGCAT